MSRSYKKPYVKGTYKGAKQRSSQVVRSTIKVILYKWVKENHGTSNALRGDDVEDPMIPLRQEVFNRYNVRDWRSYCRKDPKYYRK